jgi:hypothetical protein
MGPNAASGMGMLAGQANPMLAGQASPMLAGQASPMPARPPFANGPGNLRGVGAMQNQRNPGAGGNGIPDWLMAYLYPQMMTGMGGGLSPGLGGLLAYLLGHRGDKQPQKPPEATK